jgi:hypothetical protein
MHRLLLALLMLAAAAPQGASAEEFLVWGDMPYCRNVADTATCAGREATTARLVRAMNRTGLGTAIFLGDTKASQEACDLFHTVTRPAEYFGAFDGAMVYALGDNEWTDCARPNVAPGGLAPVASLGRLREAFFSQDRSLGARPMPLERQAASGTGMENARWQQGQALFATLHIPGIFAGSDNFPGDRAVLAEIAAANLAWLDAAFAAAGERRLPVLVLGFQADMWHPCLMEQNRGKGAACTREPFGRNDGLLRQDVAYDYRGFLARLAQRAATFPGQVLLLHGDTHVWLEDRAPGDGQGGVIRNTTRFMVPGEEDMRAVRVRVTPGQAPYFGFEAVSP